MAFQKISQEEVDDRHRPPGYSEEERESFRSPRNSSDYNETENCVSGLSPSQQFLLFVEVEDLYQILLSHFPDATSNYDDLSQILESYFPADTSNHYETENSVPELSSSSSERETLILHEQDLYRILRLHLHNAKQDQLNSLVDDLADYLCQLETISQFVASRTCQDGDALDICMLCLSEYERGEMLGTLECGHEYHGSCIRIWLREKDSCPVCEPRAIGHQHQDGGEEAADRL